MVKLNPNTIRNVIYIVAKKEGGEWLVLLSTSLVPDDKSSVHVCGSDAWFPIGDFSAVENLVVLFSNMIGTFTAVSRTQNRVIFIRKDRMDDWLKLQEKAAAEESSP